MLKRKIKALFCSILATVFCLQPCFATLPDEGIIDFYGDNGIYYYNPVGDRDVCGSRATRLAGNTIAEKIWNYFVDKGFTDGQIAGIIGNGMAESGLTPTRSTTGAYWGLFQWGPRRPQLWQKMEEAGLGKYTSSEYWGAGAEELIPEADLDAILLVELDFLMGPDDISWIDAIKETNDPETAAEIFLVTFERAVGGDDPIKLYAPYMGLLYQGTTARRNFAKEVFDEYSGNGTSVSSAAEKMGKDITIIGDSITVGSKSALKETFPDIPDEQINARSGRPWAEGLLAARSTELKDTVVFALGSNNTALTESDIDQLIEIVGTSRTIVLLTNHGPAGYEINNALFKDYAKKYSNIILVDWDAEVSKDTAKYLSSDDVHPTSEGAKLFAQLISDAINGNINNGCNVSGKFFELVLGYAWPTYHPAPYIEKMPDYAAAVDQSLAEGRYTGGGPNGGPGIDCGGFVTILVQNSGLAEDYNTNPSGNTTRQEQWVKEQNWLLINDSPSTEVDTSLLQAGDVAFSSGHTFIYVGEIPGFDSVIASASIGGSTARAPMAGSEGLLTGNGAIVRWYRNPNFNPQNTLGTLVAGNTSSPFQNPCTSGSIQCYGDYFDISDPEVRFDKAVREWGAEAVEMQIEYGTPWSLFFAQKWYETRMGTAGYAPEIESQYGGYNWGGMEISTKTGARREEFCATAGYSAYARSEVAYPMRNGKCAHIYANVGDMIGGWALSYLRNGREGYRYIIDNASGSNYNINYNTVCAYLNTYVDGNKSSSCNHPEYARVVMQRIEKAEAIGKEIGLPTAEEVAKQNNLPVGGRHPVATEGLDLNELGYGVGGLSTNY